MSGALNKRSGLVTHQFHLWAEVMGFILHQLSLMLEARGCLEHSLEDPEAETGLGRKEHLENL